MSSVTFDVAVGGDGSTVTDDNNATTGLRDGGWKTRFVPCFTQQVAVANYIVTKAGEASTSASAASASATAAAASYDSFDDRYLGAKTSDPSVDNDGNALITGAIYWNSSSSVMKVWSGSAWVSYNPAISYLPLSGGTMTGNITFNSTQFGTNVATFLATPSSANLASALTDETGTGVNVFNNTPTLISPLLGTPTSGNLSNCTNAIGYGLKSATTTVSVSAATAPSTGQALIAINSTTASWQTVSSGAMTLLSTVTASNSATVDIESTFSSTYDSYIIILSDVAPSADSVNLRVQLKINGVYQTSGYNFHAARPDNTSGAYSAQGASTQSYISIQGGIATNSRATTLGSTTDMYLKINAPASTSTIKSISWNGSTAGLTNATLFGSGQFVTSFEALTGIRFYYNSGNILTGKFRLYGISNS